jgi:hypothetical protein
MKKLIIAFACILSMGRLTGQEFEKDMERIYNSFVKPDYIHFNIRYVLRAEHQPDSRVVSETNGRYAKSKNKYISVMDSKATLVTPREVLMIDKAERKIRIKKLKEPIENSIDFLTQLKELNKDIAGTSKANDKNAQTFVYQVRLKNTEFMPVSAYDMEVDVRTNHITRLTLYYKKPLEQNEDYHVKGDEIPRLDIIFSDIETGKPGSSTELNPEHYYTSNKSQLIPTTNFKGYEIKEVF